MSEAQELHRELMTMKADYDDLNKKMEDWHKRFFELYCSSDDKLDPESE